MFGGMHGKMREVHVTSCENLAVLVTAGDLPIAHSSNAVKSAESEKTAGNTAIFEVMIKNIQSFDSCGQRRLFLQSCYDTEDSLICAQKSELRVQPSQDDCLNLLTCQKCFNVSVDSDRRIRRQYKFHLGMMNCAEALRQGIF